MKAIAYFENLPADHPEARDITLPEPVRASATCWSRCAPSP